MGQMGWEMDAERRSRKTDPPTSRFGPLRQASVSELQQKILDTLKIGGPQSDNELVASLEMWGSPSGIRTRRAELVKQGKVRDSGKRKRTGSGRNAIVWESQ